MELTIQTIEHKLQLHMGWVRGENEEFEYSLDSGGGCGGGYIGLYLEHKATGEKIWESISIKDLFNQWLEAKVPELKERINNMEAEPSDK